MRTRRSWKNQDRLYKAIGKDLAAAAGFPAPGIASLLLSRLEETARALQAHLEDASKAGCVTVEQLCPCHGGELARAKAAIAAAQAARVPAWPGP